MLKQLSVLSNEGCRGFTKSVTTFTGSGVLLAKPYQRLWQAGSTHYAHPYVANEELAESITALHFKQCSTSRIFVAHPVDMEILRAAARNTSAVAIKHPSTGTCSYGKLLSLSESIKSDLKQYLPAIKGIDGPRVGIYAEAGVQYAAATYATWMSGGIAVPLAVSHPPHELEYVLKDAGISAVLAPESAHDKLQDITHAAGSALHILEDSMFCSSNVDTAGSTTKHHTAGISSSSTSSRGTSSDGSGALIVYTSGTTGRPKGALHTHGSLAAQVNCLTAAWQWQPSDVMLHALPLHHVHGIINGLYCAHFSGATVHFLPKFSPAAMWQQLMGGEVSVLMAVPTMYSYLLSYYDSHMSEGQQRAARASAAGLRLTVSGSAAAPVPLLQRWQQLSGQQLLERYGMTETGMILSNPYEGERRPGYVGLPLPGVEVKVLQQPEDNSDDSSSSSFDGGKTAGQGELAVRGPMLFREYWGRPEATAEAFDADGFFMTGDTVSYDGEPPYYRILGRSSVDIIKSGGFKLSALDIEGTLLHHPGVAEVAVLGVPDDMRGQVIAALVHPKPASISSNSSSSDNSAASASNGSSSSDALVCQLQELCKQELASYACPRVWKLLESPLPRNAMGKVNKKELLKQFFPIEAAAALR